MGEDHTRDDHRLRRVLGDAESAARDAAEALLDDVSPVDERVRDAVQALKAYCHECPDPFQALDIARLLRALVEDMDAAVYADGPVREWAHAEVRMQSLASRVARNLRDLGQVSLEQHVIDLSILHLKALEQGPRYVEILGEMGRLLDSPTVRRPVTLVEEFFGLARRGSGLPTSERPAEGG